MNNQNKFTHNTNQYGTNDVNGLSQNQQQQQYKSQVNDAYRDISQGANLNSDKTQQFNHLNSSQLKDLFEEFKNKETNLLSAKEFKANLLDASVDKSCQLLIKKLNKIQDAYLTEQQFYDLFNFDFISNGENLSYIMELFDELGNRNQNISVQELEKINTIYNLGLSQQDLQVMIKYGGNLGDSITLEQLKQLIMGR